MIDKILIWLLFVYLLLLSFIFFIMAIGFSLNGFIFDGVFSMLFFMLMIAIAKDIFEEIRGE